MAVLKDEYKQMLLKMSPEDITAEFIFNYLADSSKRENGKLVVTPSKIKTYDTFELKKGEYFNKETVVTNVGLFIFNKFLIEESFVNVTGYINTPVTAKVQKSIENKISQALLDDKITVQQMVTYLNKLQWISKEFNSVFSGSFTMKTLKPIPKVMKRKEQLIKENQESLKQGDVSTGVKIEKELIDMAKEELKNDPGMDLYNSGAHGSFENNYKNIAVVKGCVYNPITDKWDFVESSFMEGIKKDEIPVVANSIPMGAYPKAIGTQVGGYLSKQFTAAFQGNVLDTPDSDCHTTGTLEVTITPWLKSQLIYRYIVEGNKLVLLEPDTIDKYINKKVKLRSPMFCTGDKLCSKCAGSLFYKLGIKNIGLTTSRVASTILNLNLKKFHNSTANINNIDLDKFDL